MQGLAERLGVLPGTLVLEMGYEEDCDSELRAAIAGHSGSELLSAESDEVVDIVLLWWREGDGDLVDALVDALGPLTDHGVIWLLTPKAGRDRHVEASDISESAQTAGLQQTISLNAARDWSGARLVTPKSSRSRR
jgi:hypothetical protein